MKKWMSVSAFALLLLSAFAFAGFAEHHEGTWKGEVLDIACYVAQGAAGDDHAGCAKACVMSGQPMGLLTDDGTLVLLAADSKDGKAFQAAKELAGQQATVSGSLAEKDGMKVLTVTAVKPAA